MCHSRRVAGCRLATFLCCVDAENEDQGIFDFAHRGGPDGAESFHKAGASDCADAAADGDAIGIYTFSGRDRWPQWSVRARA